MKFPIQFNTFYTAILVVYLTACSQNNVKEDISNQLEKIPVLLERTDANKFTAEYESTLTAYANLSSTLNKNPYAHAERLKLAAMFMQEARISGEHGYYYPHALALLEKTLQSSQLSDDLKVQAMILKAHVLLAQHEFGLALPIAQAAFELQPYNAQVYTALIDAHVELGHYDQAVQWADKLMSIRPNLMGYARVSYLRELYGDFPGAIEAMNMAVEAGYPGVEDTEWARVKLGELYEKNGDWQKAEQAYLSSLAVRDKYAFAQAGLARVKYQQNDFVHAEKLLLDALKSVPEISFQEDLFRLYKSWGKPTEAEEAYAGIIAMVEDDAAKGHRVALDYAKILFELGGDKEKALAEVLKEYALRPDNLDVNTLLTRIYLAQGEVTAAKKHFDLAKNSGLKTMEMEQLMKQMEG